LGGGHHAQVRHVMDAALAAEGPEGTIEDGQMVGVQAAGLELAIVLDILDGIELLDVRDDPGGLLRS
jgi:hypothetical protein